MNLAELYKKLRIIEQSMVTKKELDTALESVMVFSNEETMKQIEGSEEDIKAGRVRKINSVSEL